MFGNIGLPELLLILGIALLIFGPKKLPEVGRSIGKAMREFRKTSDEIKDRIEEEIHSDEIRDIERDIKEDVRNLSELEEKSVNNKDKNEEGKKISG